MVFKREQAETRFQEEALRKLSAASTSKGSIGMVSED
jgi:hypothetical protein